METSLIVAKVLGTYLIISGAFLMFRGKTVPHLLKDFFGHPAIVYLTGVVLIFLSSLLLIQGSTSFLITVISWIIFAKGLAYIFIPDALHRMVNKKLLDSLNLYGLIAVVAGLSLFYIV